VTAAKRSELFWWRSRICELRFRRKASSHPNAFVERERLYESSQPALSHPPVLANSSLLWIRGCQIGYRDPEAVAPSTKGITLSENPSISSSCGLN
jgi:hypothetical protein